MILRSIILIIIGEAARPFLQMLALSTDTAIDIEAAEIETKRRNPGS